MHKDIQDFAAASPFAPPPLPFGRFLALLLQALAAQGVRPCVLRNYQGFPDKNDGNDIDFLVPSSQLPLAMRALRSIEEVRIVGYTERYHVALVFLEGIASAPGVRAQQVDFIKNLTWKGLPFLATEAVLQAAMPRRAGESIFFVPSPVHEAISSLLSSLLVGGWLKEKYFSFVQQTFAQDRGGAIDALCPQFGPAAAKRLVDAVISGDRQKILACVRPLRIALALRSLLHRPVRSLFAIARYHANVMAIRYLPKALETVCVLGPDGCGNEAVIDKLLPLLRSTAAVVESLEFKPRLSWTRKLWGSTHAAGSRELAADGCFASMAKAFAWLLEEWLGQILGKKNLTLRIGEGRSYDLALAPQKHSYGGPMWFARLAGKLYPSPDLWLLLDMDVDGRKSKEGEALPAEAPRKLEDYHAFVKTKKKCVTLNASLPADRVTEEAYAAIIDMLVQRADRQLKRRFCALDAAVGDKEPAGGCE
jgi:thymidylate kinase